MFGRISYGFIKNVTSFVTSKISGQQKTGLQINEVRSALLYDMSRFYNVNTFKINLLNMVVYIFMLAVMLKEHLITTIFFTDFHYTTFRLVLFKSVI